MEQNKLLDLNNGQWEGEILGIRLISNAQIEWYNLIQSNIDAKLFSLYVIETGFEVFNYDCFHQM